MSVRKAVAADLSRIVELWFEMMSFHIDINGIYKMKSNAREIYKEYAESCIADPEKVVFVYEDENGVQGYLFAEINPLPPVYEEDKIGVFTEIGVTAEVRRRGIGKALVTEGEKWVTLQGVSRCETMVSIHNPLSQGFWKKQGFAGYNEMCYKYLNN